jgi:hypothetical protein
MSDERKASIAWVAEKLRVSAHHEAGHAVAAVLVGGSVEHLRLTDDRDSSKWGNCRSTMPTTVAKRGFNTFAGPWADVRAQWPEGAPLDGVDANGRTFSQCVAQEFAEDLYGDGLLDEDPSLDLPELHELGVEPDLFGDDLESYLWIWEQSGGNAADRATVEAEWLGKLEVLWPIIQALATQLLAVRDMDGVDVHAIVEPMLAELKPRLAELDGLSA